MDRRQVTPPPPSASSIMMAGVGPILDPTSTSNSVNATVNHHWTAADIVSRPYNSRGLLEGLLPPGLSTGGFNTETVKKKRGRPKKYSPDGNSAPALLPALVGQGNTSGSPFSEPPAKKKRGRRPGSGKKQMDSLGMDGVGFIPFVILVNPGEDIASKIMAEQAPRTMCVLSGNGAVSNVTLCQPASSGGTISYEGKYELISLSGSYLFAEDHGGGRRLPGGLSVILGGADGQVLGGAVCGLLVAATQVQVIVGSFKVGEKKMNSNTLKPGSIGELR